MAPLIALALTLLSVGGAPTRHIGRLPRRSGGERITPVKSDEDVMLFPTLSRQVEPSSGGGGATEWDVAIHGWIFEPEHTSLRRRAFINFLRKVLDLEKGEEASEILERRLRPFLYDNERGKSLTVELLTDQLSGDCSHSDEESLNFGDTTDDVNPKTRKRMPRSGRDGHFKGTLRISDNDFNSCHAGDTCSLSLRLVQPKQNDDGSSGSGHKNKRRRIWKRRVEDRVFTGTTYLLPPVGLSVISDIDDTIKLSNVLDKKKLMRNTFLKEFKPVPGMSQLYQSWSKRGAAFHFVSSSPFQLYRELHSFLERESFPLGSFHLKQIRAKPSAVLNLLSDPFERKCSTIGSIIDAYPKRTFVLVGDTGEKDPEVYGEIVRRYPNQIWRVYLRDAGEQSKERRFDAAFADVPREVWTVFQDASEISLPKSTCR
mmetsp:Transcript_2230/g.6514  ORF Transcript_2230/g.6514 Transcript_2230/m.6514 type:complete len:429 (+) Transcript_2230:22-1308(+)